MSDDFQQTVDLKIKKEKPKKRKVTQTPRGKAKEIDEVYQEEKGEKKENLKKIEKYKEPQVNEGVFKRIVLALFVLIIFAVLYFMVFSGSEKKEINKDLNWYAVKLITGEIYYGEIIDTQSDPVVIDNVYYNYDQIKDGVVDKNYSASESSNLRLVKRGKETHGPAGSMNVVRAQVVYMEPLKEDSKVLKAIMNYEK